MKSEKIAIIRNAGIVGAGGAGFPTHVKVDAAVDTVVVNAAECEPLLKVDQQLLLQNTDEFLAGLAAAVEITGAQEGVIAIKGKHKEAIARLEGKIKGKNLRIFILKDFYPAGDEQVTVYEATGRLAPQGAIPLKVGCVVANVETLLNIGRALQGKNVTHTYVTITGAVDRPATLRLPIGLSVREAVALAGRDSLDGCHVIDGGPMMGRLVASFEQPITKTTKGLIVLPADHNLITRRQLTLEKMAKRARQSCIQCRQCTDLCPRYLLGHAIEPHKIMRSLVKLPGCETAPKMVFACSECGICEQYACPMGLSPRTVNAKLKQELIKAGVKPGAAPAEQTPHSLRSYRQVPVKRLISRLGLSSYDRYAPLAETPFEARRVAIPLKQHVGAPGQPVVTVGQTVAEGDLIARIPDGALGANVHASIGGKIVEITDKIVIARTEGSEQA